MNDTVSLMMQLIRMQVLNEPFDREKWEPLSEQTLTNLYRLSSKHDLSHIVGNVLIEENLLPSGECRDRFQKAVFGAAFRYQMLSDAYAKISKTLLDAKIDFLPLKGMVTRNLYPEAWLRTSCDIDILVAEADGDSAASILSEKLGFSLKTKSEHDYQLFSPDHVHLELHFCPLDPDEKAKSAELPLADLMNQATKNADGIKELSDELFYYYHIAHMATHFNLGGCGVRPFLDLFLMRRKLILDPEKLKSLFAEGGLTAFEEGCRHLSEVWFGDGVHDELTRKMEAYLLRGGVYGSNSNWIGVKVQKQSKFVYLRKRIFLPYREMKNLFPILKKYRFLLPLFEVIRWVRLPFTGRMKKRVDELQKVSGASQESESAMKKMLEGLDLL